ncbi:MAG: DMT family transporter [Alphaproteobacteria bacterium]|jgi:drug/metabolite transporter (DMT)-like permease|nr:DMT family transporter [Alphaproteobacteria bacterium]
MNLFDWTRLIILSLLWGGSYTWIELALIELDPMMIVFYRVLLSSIFLILICKVLSLTFKIEKKIFIFLFFMSLTNNVIPFNLIAWGQQEITASVGSILNATTPLFTVIIANYWPNGEKATLNRIFGVIIGFCGVILLMGLSIHDIDNSIIGQSAILLAAISYAISALIGKEIKKIHPAISATYMLSISSVILLPIVLFSGNELLPQASKQSMIAILGLAIFSTSIAYLIFYKLIENIGSNVMLVTLLMPVSAILLSIIILNETINTTQTIGLILILTGLILVDGRALNFFKR